jgi:hypothetical protein
MAAAGDAAKVVLIDVDYKAIRTISANVSGVRWCVLLTAAARGGHDADIGSMTAGCLT